MKFKSLLAVVAVIWATLASCSLPDNPAAGNDPVLQDIVATEVTNISPNFIGSVSGLEAGQKLNKGDEVTLTITAGAWLPFGFDVYNMEHIHVHVGDKVYIPAFPDTADEYAQEVSLTVTIPEEPFSVVVAYAVQQHLKADGYTMHLESNSEGIELLGVSQELKYDYFDCYLRVPEAYTLDKVEFKMGDGEWQNVKSVVGCGLERTDVANVYMVTVRPDYQEVTGDVTLRTSGTQHKRSKITWNNTEYIRTDIPEGYQPNILPESAIGGEQVVAQFYTKDDYYLAGASASVDGIKPECMYYSYVVFTMPEEDVEITLDFREKIAVTYETSAHITSAQIYSDRDIYYGVPVQKAIPGEYVYLFASAEKGFKPLKAINDRGEESNFEIYGEGLDSYGYYASVHVPADATSMTVRAEAVTAHYAGGDNIAFDGGHYYAAGETVSFTVAIPSGKAIESVTAKDSNGADVAVTMDGAYGSFTMPDADVTVTATFKDVEQGANVTIRALYDEDQYRVTSQSTAYYGAIDSEGIQVPGGTTLYISVQDDYGEPFWVGVKIGDSIQYFEAKEDEDTGEYTFGRSFAFTADAVIKVGASKGSVAF